MVVDICVVLTLSWEIFPLHGNGNYGELRIMSPSHSPSLHIETSWGRRRMGQIWRLNHSLLFLSHYYRRSRTTSPCPFVCPSQELYSRLPAQNTSTIPHHNIAHLPLRRMPSKTYPFLSSQAPRFIHTSTQAHKQKVPAYQASGIMTEVAWKILREASNAF